MLQNAASDVDGWQDDEAGVGFERVIHANLDVECAVTAFELSLVP